MTNRLPTRPAPSRHLSRSKVTERRRKLAVLYLRVSTEKQVKKEVNPEGLSIPSQRSAATRKAAELGAEVHEREFVELGESAKVLDRPQLQALLQDTELLAEVDYVIVYNLSRLARNVGDQVSILAHLRSYGVELISVAEQISETAIGRFHTNVMGAVNQLHSDYSGEEAIRGMTEKAAAGGTPGRAPIGYRNVVREMEGRFVKTVELDPERAPLIQWAFEAYATGEYTTSSLHEALVAQGLRTPVSTTGNGGTPLHRSKVAAMLRNRYYIGYVTFRGVEYEGRHQPLVSTYVFDQVQALLDSRNRAGEKQRVHRHHLKGTIFCAGCGRRLCFTRSKGKGGSYDYFFCVGRQQRSGCQQPFLPVDDVERAIERFYRQHVRLGLTAAQEIRRNLRDELERQRKHSAPEAQRQRHRLSQLEQERRRLARGVISGGIPEDIAKEEQARVRKEMADAERLLAASQTVFERIEGGLDLALQFLDRYADLYVIGSPRVRRLSNQALFEQLLVGVDDDDIATVSDAVYCEPWATLKAGSFLASLRANQESPDRSGRGSLRHSEAANSIGRSVNMNPLVSRVGRHSQSSLNMESFAPPTGFEPVPPP
jgi:site-specific DNA recombinase